MARSVTVTIGANVTGAIQGLNRVGKASQDMAGKVQTSAGKAMASVEKNSAAYDDVAGRLTKVGAVGAAGLLAVGKAAMDWESAWAGVTKTVNGSSAELDGLQSSLRDMAKTMPAAHGDIAAVAEAAGQLGVKTQDIAGFTKVMIDLGETTNLSSDEASTSLAQFMNVMGTAGKDVDRLGATIVGLGNDGASTERDIVQMGQRIAGAGKQIGLSETEVLGFANALASVGIDAEAGGTAISTTFLKIDGAVRGGGRQLEALARTAGMTTEEFAAAFRDNAAGATTAFVEGLGQVQKSGGDTTAILKSLGITGIREGDALRRLASSSDLLEKSLATGNEAWKANTALTNEAGKRYATTESQIKIAWNNIKDAAITAGAGILPVAAQLAESISKVAKAFGDLPPGTQSVILKVAAGLTALAIAGAGVLKIATSISGLATSMRALSSSAPGATTNMGKFGKAAGGATVGLLAYSAAVSAALSASDKPAQIQSIEQITGALMQLSSAAPESAAALDSLFKQTNGSGLTGDVSNLGEAFKTAFDPGLGLRIAGVGESIVTLGGTLGRTNADKVADQFKSLDEAVTGLYSGGKTDEAATAFKKIADAAADQGVAVTDLVDTFPEYRDALLKQAQAAGVANVSAEELANWMGGEVPAAVQKAGSALVSAGDNAAAAGGQFGALVGAENDLIGATKLLDTEQQKVIKNFSILTTGAIDAESASAGWEAAIDSLASATKDATGADTNLKAARDAAAKATRDIEAAELRLKELRDNGKSSASSILAAENRLQSARDRLTSANEKLEGSQSKVSKSLNIGTEAGRKNRDMITAAVRALNEKTTADFENDVATMGMKKATDKATEALTKGEKQIKDSAKAAGFNKGEVDKMTKSMLKTPEEVRTDINTPGMDKAQSNVTELKNRIKDLESKQINITANFGIQADKAVESLNKNIISKYGKGAKTISFRAAGGPVWGPGTGTSDEIPTMLSNGEYVVKAKSVEKLGLGRLDHMNNHGEIPHFATGGLVQRDITAQARGNTPPPVGSLFNAHASVFEKGATDYMAGLGKAFANMVDDAMNQNEGGYSAAKAGKYGGSAFSAEQLRNAATIASVGSSMGTRAIKIALMTAMQESGIRELSYGDRDSVGPFQQRTPWGSRAARMDTASSAAMFFHGGKGGQPGLDDIAGWQSMSLGQAAQRVQVSAFPGAYAKWADEAQGIISAMGSGGGGGGLGKGIDTKNPRGRTQYRGHTFSNLFAANLRKSEQDAGANLQIFQGGFRPRTSYSGTSHQGDAIDAKVNTSLIRALRKNGIPTWDRTGKGNWVSHMHGIPLPGSGYPAGSAVWQGQDALRGGDGLASGGYVRGPGTATSDSINTRLSNGEFVVRTAAVNAIGVDKLHQINAMGGAQGPASSTGFASGGLVSVPPSILALIRAIENPLKDISKALAAVASAQKAKTAADKTVAKPKGALDKAQEAYEKARDARDKARLKNARDLAPETKKVADQVERERKASEASTKADKALAEARKGKNKPAIAAAELKAKRAQNAEDREEAQLAKARGGKSKESAGNTKQMAELNARVTETSKKKTAAQEAYNKVADKAKEAADKLKQAQADLAEQNKGLADQVRSESEAFRNAYQSKSTDANDWIQLMKDGAADIGAFNAKIVALRKAGLNETLIQQIIGMGAVAGTDIAAQIAKGGKGMVDSLNKANAGIQNAADTLGYTSATGPVRKASGGWVNGPGTGTSDSIAARLSNGEYVINAADAAAVRSGRKIIDRNYVQGNRYGTYAQSITPAVQTKEGDTINFNGPIGYDPNSIVRKISTGKRDALATAGLSGFRV